MLRMKIKKGESVQNDFRGNLKKNLKSPRQDKPEENTNTETINNTIPQPKVDFRKNLRKTISTTGEEDNNNKTLNLEKGSPYTKSPPIKKEEDKPKTSTDFRSRLRKTVNLTDDGNPVDIQNLTEKTPFKPPKTNQFNPFEKKKKRQSTRKLKIILKNLQKQIQEDPLQNFLQNFLQQMKLNKKITQEDLLQNFLQIFLLQEHPH